MSTPANTALSRYGTSIFAVMSALSRQEGALNLGQGMPSWDGPAELVRIAQEALGSGSNQYPPATGIPELRQAISAHMQRMYGLAFDPDTQVLVTTGATEALSSSFMALLNTGDEVICLDPTYDAYRPLIDRAGGVAVGIALAAPDWALTSEMLESAVSERTKLLVLNSPMNPTGKVFSRTELQTIADFAIAHDITVICDEAYEHLYFTGAEHVPLISLPGMADRCVKIGSAGKSFSVTGWKVGYITASADLVATIFKAHQFLVFTTPPNLQQAVAVGLKMGDGYFNGLRSQLQSARNVLKAGLEDAGFAVYPSAGTYFLCVDLASVGCEETDMAFCERITKEAKVSAIPLSPFYDGPAPGKYARFCFAKDEAELVEAASRLKAYLGN